MIELQDAIERAKLAADGEGLLSSYTYDRIVEQLSSADRHAFTMALVDLGIVTKQGSMDDTAHMQHVLAMGLDSSEEVQEDNRKISIVEEFVKAAQQFVQSPGGLWVPDTLQEGEEDSPEAYESFLEETPFVFPEESGKGQSQESEFTPSSDAEYLKSVLEENGVFISPDGMVTLYSQSVPGLFKEEVPLRPLDLDSAVQLFHNKILSVESEMDRLSQLQDILSALNSDFSEIEGSFVSLSEKFNDALSNLEQFRYSEKSKDPIIQQIGEGLTFVKGYLDSSGPHMEDMWGELRNQKGMISSLNSNIDQYYQKQYESYDKSYELVDALYKVKELQGTEMFDEIVSGMGGVVASFKSYFRSLEV